MEIRGFRAVCASAALTLVAACGGSPGNGQSNVLAPQDARSTAHANSWIGPAARAKDLLYASGASDCDVYVFTYPGGKLVQTLNACGFGFGPAFGLCSDRSGDVFMAMGEGFSIFEFAHGGSKPIAQLQNASLLPVGCSVDSKTGDLGIASSTGNVALFKNASGTPQIYSLSGVSEFFFCTFDDHGNLFADGEHNDAGHTFALAELPAGGSALREITAPGSIGSGYALQWDGHHVAIGAMQTSDAFTLDRIRVSGSAAKIVGTTTLTSAPNTVTPFEFWIAGNTIVQPENGNAEIGLWNYPRGGEQTNDIQVGSTLDGVTVSVGTRQR
jgi:hypothetical protein